LSEVTSALPVQLLVNVVGIAVMIAVAFLIAWYKELERRPAISTGAAQ